MYLSFFSKGTCLDLPAGFNWGFNVGISFLPLPSDGLGEEVLDLLSAFFGINSRLPTILTKSQRSKWLTDLLTVAFEGWDVQTIWDPLAESQECPTFLLPLPPQADFLFFFYTFTFYKGEKEGIINNSNEGEKIDLIKLEHSSHVYVHCFLKKFF